METTKLVQAFENELNLTEQGLLELSEQKKGLIIDVKTENGFKLARKERTEQNKIIKNIDDLAISGKKSVDEARNVLKDRVSEIYAPTVIAFEAENIRRKEEAKRKEQEEAGRIQKIRDQINSIRQFSTNLFGKSSDELQGIIEAVDMIDISESFAELTQEAMVVKKEVLSELNQVLSSVIQNEQLAEEREKLRKQQQQQEEKNRVSELKVQSQERLNKLIMIPSTMFGKTSVELNKKLNSICLVEINEAEFGELFDQANAAKAQVIVQLRQMSEQQTLVESAQDQQKQSDAVDNNDYQVKGTDTEFKGTDNTKEAEQPNAIDIQRFMGQIQAPSNTPEKESIIEALGYMLICDDHQLNCEAMDNLRDQFKKFMG